MILRNNTTQTPSLMHYLMTEYALLYRMSDVPASERLPSLAQVYVSDVTFEQLKKIALGQDTDALLSLGSMRGKEVLRVKNYVGLLQTPDGTQLEILPKIAQRTDAHLARQSLLKMLRSATDVPLRHLPPAHLQNTRMSLWEIFVGAFIEEVEQITRQGIEKAYQQTENSQSFLRGKWLPHRQSLVNQVSFSVVFDEFVTDIPPNRLLKTCILYLLRHSRELSHQTRLRQLRFAWDEVQVSSQPLQEYGQYHLTDRRFDRYQKAIRWAKILLQQHGWTGQGTTLQTSLLFPTERLFEQYVAGAFRQYLTDYEIIYQDSGSFLIADHQGQKRFHLHPDLVLKKQHQTFVIDIKWKWVTPSLPSYGIEQGDLYQLYAYGKKYEAQALYLLYPAHEDFQEPLPPFYYDQELSLTVIPFDMTKPLDCSMNQLKMIFDQY